MKTKTEIYSFMRKEIKSKQIAPALFKQVISVLEKAIETRMPQLIGGDQGVGKTFAVQYFAYKNGYDISIINASSELRLKSGEIVVRAELLKPSSKTKLLVLDEVEKGSNIKFLTQMVESSKKTTFQTNVILICISNNPWQLGSLRKSFGPFETQIKAPFIQSIRKALREMKIDYSGQIIRDLRFFRNIVRNPNAIKNPSISDNTFEAIAKFLGSEYIDRNIWQTKQDLNSQFWRWLILNFHHGTFNYVEMKSKRTSYPKHNTAMYHRMIEGLSRSAQYKSEDLLEFILPQLPQTRLTHPSSLNKRK